MPDTPAQEMVELHKRNGTSTTPTIAVTNTHMLSAGPSPSSTRPPSSSSGSMLSQQLSSPQNSTPPSSVSSPDVENCSPEPRPPSQTVPNSNTSVAPSQSTPSLHRTLQNTSRHTSSSSSRNTSSRSSSPGSSRRRTSLSLIELVRDRIPDSFNTQNVLAWSVVALTVATVVYSRRSDLDQIYNNLSEWYQYCDSNNYTDEACKQIKGKPLQPPPFSGLNDTWNNIWKRWSSEEPSESADPDRDMAVTIGLTTNLIVGIFTVIVGYVLYEAVIHKRSGIVRQSDMSMVRQDFTPLKSVRSASVPQPSSHEPQEADHRGKGRVRAFLTMEQAVKQMRHLAGGEMPSTDPASRRSSNPYSRRLSGLPGDDKSLYSHVHLYYHDPESTSSVWTKVKRASEGPKPPTKPIQNPLLPEPWAPSATTARDGEAKALAQRFRGKFKHALDSKPIKVYDQPPPELAMGNLGAAIAFAGSITAATVGGTVMARCPVEVTPDHGLPDSWMHMSPQDDMCALSPVSTNPM